MEKLLLKASAAFFVCVVVGLSVSALVSLRLFHSGSSGDVTGRVLVILGGVGLGFLSGILWTVKIFAQHQRDLKSSGGALASTFDDVWYLPEENKWRDLNLLAYKDTGKLTFGNNAIEFKGSKETVVVTNIRRVTLGKQGRDFVNNWVKIEYGDNASPSVAFFADGTSHGWGGIFGGTKRILEAVEHHVQGETG